MKIPSGRGGRGVAVALKLVNRAGVQDSWAEFVAIASPFPTVSDASRTHFDVPRRSPSHCLEESAGYDVDVTHLLLQWALLTFSFWLATTLLSGMHLKGGLGSHILLAGAFGLLSVCLGWLLWLVLGVLTIGLTFFFKFIGTLIVNAILLKVLDAFSDRLRIDGFGTALVAALIMAGVDTAGAWVFNLAALRP